jgi:hypothetical protein
MNRALQEEFVMYYEDYELEDIYEFNKKMLQYMLWYNTERPHHSLNKKSPLQYFCNIINSNKSGFSQIRVRKKRKLEIFTKFKKEIFPVLFLRITVNN